MKFRSLVILAFASSSCSAFVASPQGRTPIHLHQTEQGSDVSIPYDAAAKLAYETAGSAGDYAAFKDKFEADAVADVIAKRNNKQEKVSEETESPKRVVAVDSQKEDTDVEEEEEIVVEGAFKNKQIAHLQKKIKYWEGERKTMEGEYTQYLQQKSRDGKTPPIYKREGKIDHYKPGPVFDKQTDRIQTEIWTIKEQIKLTHAKIAEERRVEQVREETADRIANFDQEIGRLEDKFQGRLDQAVEEKQQIQQKADQAVEEKQQIQQKADETSKRLTEKEQEVDAMAKELEHAKEEQERIRREAEQKMKAMESKYTITIKNMQEESEKRLSEKEQEISSLSQEIEGLLMHLQSKRNQLQVKEGVVSSLETELEEKESTLITLTQERDSLRSLVGQSWKVVKTRFKKRVLRRGKKGAEEDDQSSTEDEEEDDQSVEPMLVRSREKNSS